MEKLRILLVCLTLAFVPDAVVSAAASARQQPAFAIGLRQIVVGSDQDARDIRDQALGGESAFDRLARERSLDPATAANGGYLGRIRVSDLRNEFEQALAGLGPGDISAPVPIGNVYFIFQVLPQDEADWMDAEQTGVDALERGAVTDGVVHLERAVAVAGEAFGAGDRRLARSLGTLAEAYRLDLRFEDAEAAYRRTLSTIDSARNQSGATDIDRAQVFNGLGLALAAQGKLDEADQAYRSAEEIRIAVYGTDSPEVAAVRQNVADLLALRGDHLAAARAYEKAIDAMESALGADHVVTAASRERFAAFRRSLLPVVLDRVSLLVAQADFQDEAFHRSVDELVELVRLAPLTERGYTQVRAALLQSALSGPTERVLGLGVERFPDSRVLRIHLADIYAGTGRTEAALNMLEETGRLSTPEGTDRNTDIRQQAVIFERIGDMYLALFEYDEAIAAYQRVIEIDRTAPGGHQKLARAYVSTSRLEEARAQLGLAAEVAPGDPSIHLDMAETLLSMGEAAEAVRAADRAIELGTTDPSILFIRGRALVVDGRTEEGQAQIQEYQQIDADLRAEETRTRNIDAVANRALEAFRNGDPETAAGLLEEGIRSYPAAERLHMASGIILGRAGRHQEAVDRFEAMLAGGVGRPFLVHLQLSEQYAALGDIESSRRHGAAYEQRRESEIVVVAPE